MHLHIRPASEVGATADSQCQICERQAVYVMIMAETQALICASSNCLAAVENSWREAESAKPEDSTKSGPGGHWRGFSF